MAAEDELSFEFEAQLNNTQQQHRLLTSGINALDQRGDLVTIPPQELIGQQPGNYKKNYKKTVCTYWLRGMCMKGDMCGFLHQYDVEKMPICRNLLKHGECKELDCPYKHNTEEIKECNMYKLGFCIYGPTCRYKHKPLPGPPPKPETVEAAKPKDYRDVNVVVNWANPGVMNAREHEALMSLGMGAGLKRGGGAMGVGGRRRVGGGVWDGGQQQQQQQQQIRQLEAGPSQDDNAQPFKRARTDPLNPAALLMPPINPPQPPQHQAGGQQESGQLGGQMPSIMPGLGGGGPPQGSGQGAQPQGVSMPGLSMPPLMGMPGLQPQQQPQPPQPPQQQQPQSLFQPQQQQPQVSMPPLMGMPGLQPPQQHHHQQQQQPTPQQQISMPSLMGMPGLQPPQQQPPQPQQPQVSMPPLMGMPGLQPPQPQQPQVSMPSLMGMPGLQPPQQQQQQQHPPLSMPPLMPGMSAPMNPALLMQLGLMGGMPGLQ